MTSKGLQGTDFETKDLRDHILDIPDTYVGSTELKMVPEWIFDADTESMMQVEMDLPEAVKRVTLEIISNAGDGAYFSLTEGVDPGELDFSWDDEGYITVRNGGLPVPVEPHTKSTSKELYLLPTDIFSVPLTSSNYDIKKDRVGCGRNGYGSKLTNSFSKHFAVEIGDSGRRDEKGNVISGQEYTGEWKNNMRETVTSVATPGFKFNKDSQKWDRVTKGAFKGESYVQVSWLLDFKRLNMTREHYSKEELGLFSRYMIEFSLTVGVPVTINGTRYDFRSIRKFAGLFYPESVLETSVSQFCAAKDTPFPKKYKTLKKENLREEFIIDSGYVPESQILLVDTPDEAQTFSYANGLLTIDGGVHVDKLHKELFAPIVKIVNDKIKGVTRLASKDVKAHVTVFLVNRVVNSKYGSQSKTKLESPTPNITFDKEIIKTMLSDKWDLFERLENTIGAKNVKGLAKSDGKKTAHLSMDKVVQDANQAGRSKSSECTLYIVEGKSAAVYPKKRIELDGGKDFGGVYPIQGKPMNVSSHKDEEIAVNKEFTQIKKMIGLRNGMDYTSDANFKTLRYGKLMITTDADSDGMHILGLIINLFHKYWPSLFARGFIRQLVTPVVRAFPSAKGKDIKAFYDENSFNLWEGKLLTKFAGQIKYYKGLGSSGAFEYKDDIKSAPVMVLDHNEKGRDLVDKAFDKTRSSERKVWIQDWRDIRDSVKPFTPKGLLEHRSTGHVMEYLFPPYMIDNLFRSIPGVNDGLKKSQRQVMHGGLTHFKYGSGYSDRTISGAKNFIFAAKVTEISKYHHGPNSLIDTIQKMARDYPGSNNLPPFRGFGNFGTREGGGKDAANARYVEISLPWWTSMTFNKEMINLVPRREVDGETAEPIWMPCDIPLGIINGNKGVATGWSTYIPPHHPIAVVDWIISRLDGNKRITPLAPYYTGFEGTIEMKIKTPAKKPVLKDKTSIDDVPDSVVSSSDSEIDEDDVEYEFAGGRGFVTKGVFDVDKDYGGTMDITIYEIPITTSILEYLSFIEKLREDKHISDIRDLSTTDKVNIEIMGIKSKLVNYKDLKLEAGLPLTNMVLLDNDGIPKCYDSVESILARYVVNMSAMYQTYKDHNVKMLDDSICRLKMELKIVLAYNAEKFAVHKRTDAEIDADLKRLELSQEIFDKIGVRGLSKTRIEALKKKIASQEDELAVVASKSVKNLWGDKLMAFRKEYMKRNPKKMKDLMTIEESSNMIIDGELSYKKAKIIYG